MPHLPQSWYWLYAVFTRTPGLTPHSDETRQG